MMSIDPYQKKNEMGFVPHWYVMTALIVTGMVIMAAIIIPALLKQH